MAQNDMLLKECSAVIKTLQSDFEKRRVDVQHHWDEISKLPSDATAMIDQAHEARFKARALRDQAYAKWNAVKTLIKTTRDYQYQARRALRWISRQPELWSIPNIAPETTLPLGERGMYKDVVGMASPDDLEHLVKNGTIAGMDKGAVFNSFTSIMSFADAIKQTHGLVKSYDVSPIKWFVFYMS